MADIDGSWDTVTKTPLGEQQATLTIRQEGSGFTGTYSGAMGSVDIENGQVEGDTLRWKVSVTVPMPLTLDCTARIEGDTITGDVGAGAFGSFLMTGTRVG